MHSSRIATPLVTPPLVQVVCPVCVCVCVCVCASHAFFNNSHSNRHMLGESVLEKLLPFAVLCNNMQYLFPGVPTIMVPQSATFVTPVVFLCPYIPKHQFFTLLIE